MRKNSIIENKLKQEIKVPEQVQNRVDDTLKAITQEKHISLQETKTTHKKHWYQGRFRVAAASLLLGILVIGTTAGAYSIWEKKFEAKHYDIEEKERDELKKDKILNDKVVKVTKHGVTIECVETVSAGRYAYILLKVAVPEHVTLDQFTFFKECDILENEDVKEFTLSSSIGSIYSWDETNEQNMFNKEQGIFYVDVALDMGEEVRVKGKKEGKEISWNGRTVSISLENLKQNSVTEGDKILVKGKWNLNIPIKSSTKEKVYEVNQNYYRDSTIHTISLTPISMNVSFAKAASEDEEEKDSYDYLSAYAMTPIEYELEDGTRKKIEIDFCESNTIYEETGETGFEISTKRIMDIDHIVAVYFAGKRVALE